MSRRPILLLALVTLCVGMPVFSASAEKKYGPGVSDTEIMIGQTMPYSGPYSSAGSSYRAHTKHKANSSRKISPDMQKDTSRSHKRMAIPIAPELQKIIDRSPTGDLTFLVAERGKPFTAAGFGNWFRDRCDEAALKGLSAHGLRKALQTIGAESGLSDRQIMAIAGHETPKMTSLYTRDRDRASLAESGMKMLSEARFGNKSVQLENGSEKVGQKEIKN